MILNGGYKSGSTLHGGYTGAYTGGNTLTFPAVVVPGQSYTINWSNLGSSQGTGGFAINGVAQTITAWSDSEVTFTAVLGTNSYGKTLTAVLTLNSGLAYSGDTEYDTAATYGFVDMTEPNTTDPSSVAYQTSETVVAGDQFEWQDVNGIGSSTNPLEIDGRGFVVSMNEEGEFLGRFWDATDETWGPWETFTAALVGGVVQSVSVPANGTYVAGDSLTFVVTYDRAQTVTGTPTLPLSSGTGTFNASYSSGSGSTDLTFIATIPSGAAYTGTLAVGSSIELNGGTINNSEGIVADTTLQNVGSTTGVVLDTTNPSIVSVAVPANGTYSIGDNLDFTVTFSEAVTIVNSPRLRLNIGGSTKYAAFVNAPTNTTALFRYTVVEGDSDSNGIDLNAFDLNGATVRDAAGNNLNVTLNGVGATTGVLVDTGGPAVVNVSVPVDGVYSATEVLTFTVTFDEAVTVTGAPRIPLVVGADIVYADYVSGSTTTEIVFEYTIVEGLETETGIELQHIDFNGGTMQSSAGLDINPSLAVAPTTAGVQIDSLAPAGTVNSIVTSSVQPALSGTVDDSTAAVVVSPGSVTATNNGDGTWSLGSGNISPLSEGLNTITAVFTDAEGNQSSASGIVDVQIAQIAVVANDLTTEDNTPIVTGTVSLTPATVEVVVQGNTYPAVLSGNNWSAQITAPLPLGQTTITANAVASNSTTDSDTATITVGDTSAPTIEIVTPPAAGIYIASSVLSFEVTFSEPVQVTGSPQLPVAIGSNTRNFVYVSGAGSDTLIFSYTVVTGDNDHNGIEATTLSLNGGTIRDLAGNDASLAFPSTPTSGVIIDTEAAVITIDPQTTINPAPIITGTCNEVSADLTLRVNGIDYSPAVNSDGTWEQQIGSLAVGQYGMTLNAVDVAGNVSAEATATLVISLAEEVSDPSEPDRLSKAITLLKRRLGRYTDNPTDLDDFILDELIAAQNRLENKTSLPWFMKTRVDNIQTTPGQEVITVPYNWVRIREDWEKPVQLLYEGEWRNLPIYSYDQFWENTSAQPGVPHSAAQDGRTIVIGPPPKAVYQIRLAYFAREFELKEQKVVSNAWLKYAFDLIVAEAGFILANNYLKNMEAAQQFAAEIERAERDLRMTTIAYETAAMESWELNNGR